MHTEISYAHLSNEEADIASINDLREYLGEDRFQLVTEALRQATKVEEVHLLINTLNIIAGVSGRPVHALARRECLALFREFMHSDPDPFPTDEQGYPIEAAEQAPVSVAPPTGAWQLLRCHFDDLGLLPEIILADDPRPVSEQINERYAHGGGWMPLSNWRTLPNFGIQYPDDPPLQPLATLACASGEVVCVYDYAWVGVWKDDNLIGVSRLD